MEQNNTIAKAHSTALFAGQAWFDPIEAGSRDRVRGFIEELLEQELTQALGRSRHERAARVAELQRRPAHLARTNVGLARKLGHGRLPIGEQDVREMDRQQGFASWHRDGRAEKL